MRTLHSFAAAFAGLAAALLVGCGGDGGEITTPTGSLEVRTTTSGEVLGDYQFATDGGAPSVIGANAVSEVADVETGTHVIQLSGLPEGCTVGGENPRTVTVTAGASTIVEFAVSCIRPVGTIQVTATTTGPAPASYELLLDGVTQGPIGANAVRSMPETPQGPHTVGLGGVPANCQLEGPNPQSATLASGATLEIVFVLACTSPPMETGSLTITTTTTGADPDGFHIVTDGGAPQPVALNGTLTLPNVAVGSHTVRLTGLAPNCSVGGPNPRTVTVSAGATSAVAFVVQCAPTVGGIEITVATSGSDLDPDGYTYQIDAQPAQPIAVNATVTVENLTTGPHTVLLSGQAPQCSVREGNSRSVTVRGGDTVVVRFEISCERPGSQIAFSSNGAGLQAIFVVNPDGSSLRRLSPSGASDRNPVWSPDGSRILFSSGGDLYVMNRDGTARTRVVDAQNVIAYRWSPDASMIAYTQERPVDDDVFEDLWVVRSDGSSAIPIASNATYPTWAPDGRRIAYASDRAGDQQVHIINSDGTGDVALTAAPVVARQTSWSPDGSAIAFVNVPDRSIQLINPDGSGLVNLTQGQGEDDSPVWSPDSRMLTFATGSPNQPLESEVAVMNRDGTGRVVVTTHAGFDFGPDWSPDGSRIVFTRSVSQDSEVYVMNRDGSAPLNVSNRRGTFETAPDWGGSAQPSLASRASLLNAPRLRRMYR
jgi:Tol biopolymer transport system component